MKKYILNTHLQKFTTVKIVFLVMILIGNYSSAHEIFINMNGGYNEENELFARQKEIEKRNKEKKCDDKIIICDKIFRIPKSGTLIDNNNFSTEFFKTLDEVKSGKIDTITISAHSDGKYFGNSDKTNPNLIEINRITAIFKELNEKESPYLNRYSNSGNTQHMDSSVERLNRYKKIFKPEALILMSCFSLEDDINIATWFKGIDSLKYILGSTNVWPLAGKASSKSISDESFKLRELVTNADSNRSTIEEYFRKNFTPFTTRNPNKAKTSKTDEIKYNLGLVLRTPSDNQNINFTKTFVEDKIPKIQTPVVSIDLKEKGNHGTADLPDTENFISAVRAIRAANAVTRPTAPTTPTSTAAAN